MEEEQLVKSQWQTLILPFDIQKYESKQIKSPKQHVITKLPTLAINSAWHWSHWRCGFGQVSMANFSVSPFNIQKEESQWIKSPKQQMITKLPTLAITLEWHLLLWVAGLVHYTVAAQWQQCGTTEVNQQMVAYLCNSTSLSISQIRTFAKMIDTKLH